MLLLMLLLLMYISLQSFLLEVTFMVVFMTVMQEREQYIVLTQ